jgi:hypothetical protein
MSIDFSKSDWRRSVEKGNEMTDENTGTVSVGDEAYLEGLGKFLITSGGIPPSYNDLRNAMQDAEGIERSSYVALDLSVSSKLAFLVMSDSTLYAKRPSMMIAEAFELSAHLIRNVSLILHEANNLNLDQDEEGISKVVIIQCSEFSREFFAKVYYLLYQLEYHYQVRVRNEDFDPTVALEINGPCEPFVVERSPERVKFSEMLLTDFAEVIHDLMFSDGLLTSSLVDNTDSCRNARRIMGHLASSLHIDLAKEVGLFCDWAIDNRMRQNAEMEAAAAREEAIIDGMVANDVGSSMGDSLVHDDLGDGTEFPEDGDDFPESFKNEYANFPKDGSELDLDSDDRS